MIVVSVVLVRAIVSGATLRDLAPDSVSAPFVSVSHTDGLSAIATCSARIGIDVELVRPRPFVDRLAARVMTAEEFGLWREATDPATAFAQHWTRYEAYVKALGVGIAAGYRARPGTGWSIIDLDLGPPHVGSLAVEADAPAIRCRWSTAPATSG